MNNPALSLHSPLSQKSPAWRRYAGISLAVVLNGGLIWALASGLTIKLPPFVPHIGPTKIIDEQPKTHQIPPPPDPTILKRIETPTVPDPIIDIDRSTSGPTIAVQPQTDHQQQTTPPPVSVQASAIGGTHSTPPYPPVARRLGEDGTVILSITVGTDGSVTAAQIATSSGVPELDQAAVDWVKGHWRYKPAMQNGVAVPSSTQVAVKFDLRKA